MSETLPLSSAMARFAELVDRVERQRDRVIITRDGQPAAVLISHEDLECLEETLSALTDRDLMRQTRDSEAAVAAGDVVSLDDVRKKLAGETGG